MQIEEINSSAAIIHGGKWIGNVHVADNTRVEPGVGSMDFKKCFDALQKTGYSGYIEIESRVLSGPPEKVLPKSASFLKKLINK